MTRLDDYPGLKTADDYFEYAYQLVDEKVARVRFRKVQADPTIDANIALIPTQLTVIVSASLVDEDEQVRTIEGRGLLGDHHTYVYDFSGDGDFNVEAWIDEIAGREIDKVLKNASIVEAASILLAPIATPAVVPVIVGLPNIPGTPHLALPAPDAGG